MQSIDLSLLDKPMPLPSTAECLAGGAAFLEGLQARDWRAVARTLHPDIRLVGPYGSAVSFGEYEVVTKLQKCRKSARHLRLLSVLGTCERPVIRLAAHNADREFDVVLLLEVDELGQVNEITLFARPL